MKRMLVVIALVLVASAAVTAVQAQAAEKPVSWQFYGGWAPTAGTASDFLKDGWDLGFGVTWRPDPSRPIGLKFDTDYAWWDAENKVTQYYRVDNGRMRSWAMTADFIYESKGRGRVGWYGGVGVGGYGVYTQLTEDALVGGYYCDWWGYCWYATVPGEVVVADKHTIKFGYNAQLGIRFKLAGGSELALETKYNWVQTKQTFEYYPINLAFRF